jgi:signal transduction histidine kinase
MNPSAMRTDEEREAIPLVASRLRLAAVIALGAIALFLPLQVRFAPADLGAPLLLVYAVSAGLAILALGASYGAASEAQIDRVALAVALGLAANTSLYLSVSPRFPTVVAFALSILMMGSALLFTWRLAWMLLLSATSLGSFALVAWRLPSARLESAPWWFAFGALVIGAGVALASARLLGIMRGSLARREAELAALSARLMSLEEEDRRRLAHELHEELAQVLTAALSHLWLLEEQLGEDGGGLRPRVADARHLVSQTLGQMRALSQLLRPSTLDDYGLVPSLEAYLHNFAARHEIETSLRAEDLPDRLPAEMETAIYRITQEALTNVARHAGAGRVRLALSAVDGHLQLEVADDGVGLPRDLQLRNGARRGLGLIGIRERVRALGGTMALSSDQGARLQVRLPLLRADR